MSHARCPAALLVALIAVATASARSAAEPATPEAGRFVGATALLVPPENSYNGYDASIHTALLRRGFEVVAATAEDLVDAARLRPYDLVVTNLKRSFTPAQVAALKAYLATGGALYANWGGPMGTPSLLAACGARSARSVYIRELTLTDSPLTAGQGEQRWPFPEFAGHARMGDKGHEMVAFEPTDGTVIARDRDGHCLGTLRAEGPGRCALLGFCPSNYRFIIGDRRPADAVLDRLLAWLLPQGLKPHPLPPTLQVCLPRQAQVSGVAVNDRPLAAPAAQPVGSLTTVTVPVGALAPDQTTRIRVDCTLPPASRHIETWLHDPVASSFVSFTPTEAADFLTALHTTVVQPLLRYEGGSVCYLRHIAGDRPRERFAKYEGDLLAEYVAACHARGIKVIGGLYLDWKRFERHLAEAPPFVGAGQAPPERKRGQPVCPLDPGVQQHNLSIVENLLANYPALDGLILDDNFEFHQRPCHCAACQERFAAWCRREAPPVAEPAAEAKANSPLWRAFWKAETLSFCRRVRGIWAAQHKPVGGWTGQRGPLAFKGVFDFAGDMVYVEPPDSVAPLLPETAGFPMVTLLWGMNRQPADMESDFVDAVRAGSTEVGFWIAYSREPGVTDNPWSLGSRMRDMFALTPGSLTAIQRAFAGAEPAWRQFYQDNLIRGDARYVVNEARFDAQCLSLTVQRLARPSARRVIGTVDLSGVR